MIQARNALLVLALSSVACSSGGDSPATVGDSDSDVPLDASSDETRADVVGGPDSTAPTVDASDGGDGADAAIDSGGCPTGPFGGKSFPPACYRPFAKTSVFNTKLPATPKIMVGSDAIIKRVIGVDRPIAPGATQIANMLALDDGTGGWPTYWAVDKDPLFHVDCTEFGGGCSVHDASVSLHIPAGALIQGGCGADVASDRHLTVVDQSSGWEYDLWHVATCPIPASGGTIKIGWGGRAKIDGDGLDTAGGNGMASHFANNAGRARAEELAAHVVDHALNIVIDCDSGNYVFPAQASDKKCADPVDAPPMGARLQLAMTAAEIDALAAPPWKKALLHAMADYGMFFGDTGSSFYFDIQTEGGNQYTAVGADDAWLSMAKANGWSYYGVAPYKGYTGAFHNGDDGIDWRATVWSKLRVIDPCVSQGTCP